MTNTILLGCPNCGKTSLFNTLTGKSLKTGNYSGVTVESKSGKMRSDESVMITDLPGIYSLCPCSDDEKAAIDEIKKRKDSTIINVADGTNLKRSLYLTLALAALGRPMVLAVNMMDELKKYGGRLNLDKLSEKLGIKAVGISATKGEGIDELKKAVLEARPPKRNISHSDIPSEAKKISDEVWVPPIKLQHRADKLLFGRYTAIPVFILVMTFTFYIVFDAVGPFLSGILGSLGNEFSYIAHLFLSSLGFPYWANGLITSGILGGMNEVLQFLPSVLLFFLLMSVLEDTGYMARVICIFDRIFVSFGLSGRIIIPLITGFGCSVPAIMACRTLGSEKEKKVVMHMLPFFSCTAKIPVYSLLSEIFFPSCTFIVITSLYFLGISIAVLTAFILKKTSIYPTSVFITELPPYRIPTVKSTYRLLKRKTREFVSKVCKVVLISSAVIWILSSYNTAFERCSPESSMLCYFGNLLSVVFVPLGFGSWQVVSALIAGFAAKEAVASSLVLLCDIETLFSPLSAFSFMVFVLLYTPCIPSVSCMKKETDKAFALSVAVRQLLVAYAVAFIVYNVGSAF